MEKNNKKFIRMIINYLNDWLIHNIDDEFKEVPQYMSDDIFSTHVNF